jgi:subtilisin family serine protease
MGKKYKVKIGKGEITVQKSSNLVGLKTRKEKDLTKTRYVDKQVFENMGGFKVVSLDANNQPLDEQLDEVRKKREIESGTHVFVAEGDTRPLVPTGEIYIIFEPQTDEEEQLMVLDEFKLELVERRGEERIIAKVTKNSPNPIKTAAALQNVSLVSHAEPDVDTYLDEYMNLPADGLLKHQWSFDNPGKVVDLNYPMKEGADAKIIDAWNRLGNLGASNIKIAVIDNGFDYTHPDLKDKIHKPFNVWSGKQEMKEDHNFTHGTPCASIAIAAANGAGMVGVAPKAKFMPLQGTSYSLRSTEMMFDYCIDNGADVISCSWGTTDARYSLSPLKEDVLAKAATKGRNGKGCVVLFAAGNEGKDYVNFYGAHPDMICVGSSDSKDRYSTYSNRGRELTIVAPSNGDWPVIAARAYWDLGTTIRGEGQFRWWADGTSRGERYKHFGGTSAATPLVAGICGLMLSANPDLTAKEVKSILQSTADKIGSPLDYDSRGHSLKYGYGRVNADKAVAEALRRADGSGVIIPPVVVEEAVATGRGLFHFSVKRQESKGWGVQIGAFAEYGNVLIQVEKLQSQFGEPVIVNINELNGKTVYKIVVGAFSNQKDAERLANIMKQVNVKGFLRNLKDLQ